MSTLVERIQQQEQYRARPEVRLLRSTRSLELLHRISFTKPELFEIASRAFQSMNRAEEGKEIKLSAKDLGVEDEHVVQLLTEIDRERLLMGDQDVLERKAFLEARKETQKFVKDIRSRGLREYVDGMEELMSDREKESSELFREMNEVLQDVAREMGFRRPVVLEITRSPELNAFIFQVDKEGELYSTPSNDPVRIFVHSGLVSRLDLILKKMGKEGISKDHLAGLLGHELQHVIQPEYDLDKPPTDLNISKRFEYDSDLAGMEAADRAGYNPRAAIELYQALETLSKNKEDKLISHFFGKHPISENRVKALEGEFQRPERVWFSAEVILEPLGELSVGEAREFCREELLKKLDEARTTEDWDAIIQSLKDNPRATYQDAELAMKAYTVFLDSESWTIAALQELQTGSLGLSKALVYAANAFISKSKRSSDVSIWSFKPFITNEYQGKNTRVHGMVKNHLRTLNEDNLPTVTPLDSDRQKELMKKLNDVLHEESSLIPLTPSEQPIQSLQEIIEGTTKASKLFWDNLSMDGIAPKNKREYVLMVLAKIIGNGQYIHIARNEEEMALRGKAIEDKIPAFDLRPIARSVLGNSVTYSEPRQTRHVPKLHTVWLASESEFIRQEEQDHGQLFELRAVARDLFLKQAGRSEEAEWLLSSKINELFFQQKPTEFPKAVWKEMIELYRHLPILEEARNAGLPEDIQKHSERTHITRDEVATQISTVFLESLETIDVSEIGKRLILIREMANIPHLTTISNAHDTLFQAKKKLFEQWIRLGLRETSAEEFFESKKKSDSPVIASEARQSSDPDQNWFQQLHARAVNLGMRWMNPGHEEYEIREQEYHRQRSEWEKQQRDRKDADQLNRAVEFLASEMFARYFADHAGELRVITSTTIQPTDLYVL